MMKKVLMVLLFTVFATVAMSATNDVGNGQGRPPKRPDAEEIFNKMDANSDGCVSLEEFKDAHQKRMQHEREGRNQNEQGDRRGPPGK